MSRDDNELIVLAQEKNEIANNELHEKYMPLIISKAKKIYKYVDKKGLELSDVIQECLIGFGEAVLKYNQDLDSSFLTFANLCMDRQMNTLILKANRDKHKILNEAVSLDTFIDAEESINLLDIMGDKDSNPEDKLMDLLLEKELVQEIRSKLTNLETIVFDFKIQGFTYKEIADILDKDIKAIDNAVQRIRAKIKDIINK